MNLKELLGEAYKDDMSFADIEAALKDKKLVDLASGGYVDVNKYNREVGELKDKISAKDKELKTANTDKTANQSNIESLQAQIKQLVEENNRTTAIANIAEAKSLLDIKDDDSEYKGFVQNVSGLDKEVSGSITSYVNKQIKAAYEKGKTDGTKNDLGRMGKTQTGSTGDGTSNPGEFGTKLAKSMINDKASSDYYFSRK